MQTTDSRPSTRQQALKSSNKGLLSKLLAPVLPKGISGRNGGLPGSALQAQIPAQNARNLHVAAATASVAMSQGPAASGMVTVEQTQGPIDLGFMKNIEDRFTWGKHLGKGGNGVVRVVVDKDGTEFACKSILKVLKEGSETKKAGHLDALRREIAVLTKLKGSLNIIKLEAVYEDDEYVHIVQEYCTGGELYHAIGDRHYSERTVASYMRACLRTLAQCHAHHILHRDIKPGNFMLLSSDDRAPLKAIDFGLAVPFEPEELPLTNLGLEGTPWFMAPETLSSQFTTATDVWAAGVMAFQLLTGRFPFDDKKNPVNPSITAIWRAVLNDPLELDKPWWNGISAEAKDFVRKLLDKDPAKRPSAKEALKHPWLQGNSSERSMGKKLQQSVVARLQRFAGGSQLKRSVLQMIASEILEHPNLVPVPADASLHNDRGRPVVAGPTSAYLQPVMQQLNLDKLEVVEVGKVAVALKDLGFRLTDSEIERLLEQLDPSGTGLVSREAFAASQVDWRYLQRNHKEAWLSLAREAFQSLDRDQDGVLQVEEIMSHLRQAVPDTELQQTVDQALEEAGHPGDTQGMDFNDFVAMLKVSSIDSLDMYDERLGSTWGNQSVDRLNQLLQKSHSQSLSSVGDTRHGASLQAALADVSNHSDRTDRSNMFDMDMSQHGVGGSQRGPWRFDTGGSGHGPSRTGSGQTAFRFDVGGSGHGAVKPVAPASGAAKAPAWRFDVAGPTTPEKPAQPAAAPAWRFDVAGPGSAAPAQQQQAPHASAAAVNGIVFRFEEPRNGQQHPSQQAENTAPMVGLGLLRNGGGNFDRRHHGSGLYKAALSSHFPLPTVQE